jgi:SAM-dependent methyltransferase
MQEIVFLMPKGRESGMPECDRWESFFDPPCIVSRLGCHAGQRDVAEFGCGYGTFSLPVAKTIAGTLFAFDIEPDMVSQTMERAQREGISNIVGTVRDCGSSGTGLADGSMDFVMLFNILHIEDSEELLREAARILALDGTIGVIHWRSDILTPRGPSLDIRPTLEMIKLMGKNVGLVCVKECRFTCSTWHWGLSLGWK